MRPTISYTSFLFADFGRAVAAAWPTKKLISGRGGYTDVILHEHEGKEWAAVVYECNTCTIKVAMIDPKEMLPKPTPSEESSPSLKTDRGGVYV